MLARVASHTRSCQPSSQHGGACMRRIGFVGGRGAAQPLHPRISPQGGPRSPPNLQAWSPEPSWRTPTSRRASGAPSKSTKASGRRPRILFPNAWADVCVCWRPCTLMDGFIPIDCAPAWVRRRDEPCDTAPMAAIPHRSCSAKLASTSPASTAERYFGLDLVRLNG